MEVKPTIYVVDDDAAITSALSGVANLMGFAYEHFSSADAFLESYDPKRWGCLVLDLKLPGMNGLELQQELTRQGSTIPIIMISGHGDVRAAVDSMRSGAVTFLEKPFQLDELCREVERAVVEDAGRRRRAESVAAAQAKIDKLTVKEREVLEAVASGHTNKQIAEDFGLSVRAVEDRRARMLRKLGMSDLSELIDLVNRLQ